MVAELLQYIPDDLLEDLLVLYNGVLREGCVPHSWDVIFPESIAKGSSGKSLEH